MVIAVDNSSASRKAMSHGMAMAGMLKSPPEVKIIYAIGLNPEQTKPIQFLWVNFFKLPPHKLHHPSRALSPSHYRDSLDRRNNMDIQEDSKVEVEQIKSWLNEFSKEV